MTNLDQPSSYCCAICGEIHEYEDDYSQEDMMKEYRETFPEEDEGIALAIVCDDCYEALMEALEGTEDGTMDVEIEINRDIREVMEGMEE